MNKTNFWQKQKPPSAIIPPTYFQGHECRLPNHKMSAFGIRCSKWRRMLLELTTVSTDDIRAHNMFKSYAALSAEKYRQYLYHPLSIHPFSKLRLWLEVLFVITTLLSNVLLSFHYTRSLNPQKTYHNTVMYFTDILIMVHILANCFTGYVEGHTYTYVVLDLKKVVCKYTRTWLVVDLLSAISFLPGVLKLTSVTPNAILVAMRLFRVPIQFIYLRNISKAFQFGIRLRTCIEITMYILAYIMWNIYFQFATEYIIEDSYQPENPRACSWMTLGKIWNESSTVRFIYSLERAIAMLRKNPNMTIQTKTECSEFFYVTAWMFAKILTYHCGLKYIISMYGQESAAAKYFTMTRQVEIYMNQRKLPPRIKKKILKFYAIRYQSCFFVEAQILSCVSGQLREDIVMHTGRQLVRQLEFLQQLPRTLLLQIGFKLKLVIFIAGDIIYKINTIGDCLYFIDKGTVAVYSGSGREAQHLEDGDFFGEGALVTNRRARSASVVAVTNCELFRLDREDFDTTIGCYPSVYEHIKKVATYRQERTSVIDEQHNTDINNSEIYTKERL